MFGEVEVVNHHGVHISIDFKRHGKVIGSKGYNLTDILSVNQMNENIQSFIYRGEFVY